MVSFIIALLSIVLSFLNSLLGAIYALISIIVGIMTLKEKDQYNKLGLIISAIVILLNIIIISYNSFRISNAISNINDRARNRVNELNSQYNN